MPCSVFSHSGAVALMPAKPIIVVGSISSEEAKIGGMTPAVLIFKGRNELSPMNMRLPCWRLGYCTTRRRCERSMKTMNTMHANITKAMARMAKPLTSPV